MLDQKNLTLALSHVLWIGGSPVLENPLLATLLLGPMSSSLAGYDTICRRDSSCKRASLAGIKGEQL